MSGSPIGQTIGNYRIDALLGSGGMGHVYRGTHIHLNRPVAVKLMHANLTADRGFQARFLREAQVAASLNHPNIVAVHDSGEHDGTSYIVMERLPGNSLADAIAAGPLPQPLVRRVIGDVLGALGAAHDAGILHRDIKPANILFTPSGVVKLSDFGIAKTAGVDLTAEGQVVGTMAYLSPGRVVGEAATVADDLYSVGVVGYEALTGRRPFNQENVAALARSILDQRPPPITVLRPDVDPVLAGVVMRAMERDPAQRFSSARQMRAALDGAAAAVGAPVRPPTAVMTSPGPPATFVPQAGATGWKPPGRRQTFIGVAVVAIVLVAAAALLMTNSPFDTPEPASTSTSAPPPSAPPSPRPTTAAPAPATGPPSEDELEEREEQQKKLEEQQEKREEQQEKREEEQRKRDEERGQ